MKPTTPLQPLIQASVKPPSPMLAPEQHPLKPTTPMQAKNAPKTPNSHPQRRCRFQLRLGLCPQRRQRFQTTTPPGLLGLTGVPTGSVGSDRHTFACNSSANASCFEAQSLKFRAFHSETECRRKGIACDIECLSIGAHYVVEMGGNRTPITVRRRAPQVQQLWRAAAGPGRASRSTTPSKARVWRSRGRAAAHRHTQRPGPSRKASRAAGPSGAQNTRGATSSPTAAQPQLSQRSRWRRRGRPRR